MKHPLPHYRKRLLFGLVPALLLAATLSRGAEISAKAGTVAVDGGADGVAIWVHPSDPAKSAVLGARPGAGLAVFSLDGKLLQKLDFPKGGAGEVDVRDGFPLGGKRVSLVAGGVKGGQTLYACKMNPDTRQLEAILADPAMKTGVQPYGSCLYHSRKTGKFFLFITSKSGDIEQYEMAGDGHGKVAPVKVRTIRHRVGKDNVIEACVADDPRGWVFFSQENKCKIWRYPAEPDGGDEPVLVDMARIAPGDNVEGLAIARTGKDSGYLIASIQGSWTYKVYDRRPPHALIAQFKLKTANGKGIVQSHDCIEVVTQPLGADYPAGLFVTQNANNPDGYHFQLVSWKDIAGILPKTRQ